MISNDRKQHIWGVAKFLKEYAISQKFLQEDVEALYLLGLLHDIGYEFLEEKDYITHNVVGGGASQKTGVQILERSVLSRRCKRGIQKQVSRPFKLG